MIFGLVLIALVLYLFYLLFIKGIGFGILLCIFGAIGGKMLISFFFPQTNAIAFTFDIGHKYGMSWASILSLLIVVLGVGFFSRSEQ